MKVSFFTLLFTGSLSGDQDTFTENKAVTFAIQPSKKHADKYEAVGVRLLITEQDQSLLLHNFLSNVKSRGVYSDYTILQKALRQRITTLFNSITDDITRDTFFRQYLSFLVENASQENTIGKKAFLETMLRIGKDLFEEHYFIIAAELNELISEETNEMVGFIGTQICLTSQDYAVRKNH